MKAKKGISMISLVVIVVVTIILIGIATTAGYKYITEGNRVKAEAVVSVISEAAYRRQNDLSSGVAVAYYEGYSIDVYNNKEKYAKITGLPEKYESGDIEIPDCLEEDGAKWYLFDAESALALGVQESERFITRNISYPEGLKNKDEITLVLADYSSGKGYLVNMPWDTIDDSLRQEGGCLNSPDGNHNYKIIATCTKPAMCIYCGEADPDNPALGHNFTSPTCTASGICRRCGAVDPDNGPLGHLMITNGDINNIQLVEQMAEKECRMYKNVELGGASTDAAWITDTMKHWHECLRCGEKSNEKEHKKGCIPIDGEYHYDLCSECGWESIKAKHVFKYKSLTENTHLKRCDICSYEETHTDSGWLPNHPGYHYRICDETDKCYDTVITIDNVSTEVLFIEAHYDLDKDLYCDVCGRLLDFDPPHQFGSSTEYYGKMTDATTSTITVEAFTVDDGSGVDYYQFRIVGLSSGDTEWSDKCYPPDTSSPVKITFENLKANTEYTIYVKAADKAGNFTAPYKIPDTKTRNFPDFNGLTNIPDNYVKGPIHAGIAPIETDLTDINVEYSLDDGQTWISIPIGEIATATITLTKEIEKVKIKFTDNAETPNESAVWEYVIEKIDLTPPEVTLSAKTGDNNTTLATYHYATVTLTDTKSGMAPDTEVRYAWSTSNTEVPTEFETLYTKNLETASKITFDIITPKEVKGNYYLWILEGIEDRVGNATPDPVCSEMYFSVDDQDVLVSNIQMLDLSPAVDGEYLFVKTDGMVTISFDTDKELGQDAIVTLNGQKVTMQTNDGLKHVGAIKITDSFDEGVLQLQISNIVSITGKVSTEVYTNDDIVPGKGPVIYDRTLPVLEYISKQ